MAGGDTMGGWGFEEFEDLERWAAGARAREAVDARVRERWLRRQAEDEADFAGLLLGLAEQAAEVVVGTITGRSLVGRVVAVGDDFVLLSTSGARITLVSLAAVAAVRSAGGDRVSPGRRRHRRPAGAAAEARGRPPGAPLALALIDVLASAVAERPRVQVRSGGGVVVGELRAVGADVASVYTDGDPPGVAYVRLASVSEVSLLDSG